MTRKIPEIFLDTSVIIAAVMSPTGERDCYSTLLMRAQSNCVAGKGVLREAEEVMRRKAPELLGFLAQLLDEAGVEICDEPTLKHKEQADSLIDYVPDAHILAQAISAQSRLVCQP